MPSFDVSSDANMVNIKNAIDVAMRTIKNRYDFQGTSAAVELNEKEMNITLFGDAEFQLNQVKDILFPSLEKKEPNSSKRLISSSIETVSGNKVKQNLSIKSGIDIDFAKQIIKTLKDAKLKVQASIQGEEVRVNGNKRDDLQEAISLIKQKHNQYPLNFGNFRD
ncbi:MAG: YajQ family cyclic di-GMP-binding protein [Proteobacteria bacterium]|jgi:cyclic-di-GMP-binding protein|nr:YajQ family cyclic di-GMP-binding protein [Pseudomonadota bacterium]MDA0872447.1 YajQ family cyclic di-GMP-binding protein [Pseudomonadota bacterium]MDA1133493.1 YajQ family cyclic di-GMP-binding protein [Pseudomonadota bacterium]